MIQNLNDLFTKKLIIVSGKGGVGKTTVSLALALLAVERGKRALIAEINSEGQLTHLLDSQLGKREVAYPEIEILPGLFGINITPKKAFEEYVLLQIKFKTLYKAVFENKFVRYFLEATPGLSDLMCIGKVYAAVDGYDLVIVDAPATGHGISLLQIASVVSKAVKMGPLKTQADKINQLLHDPKKTQIVLVSLPEEMPVTESLEMGTWLQKAEMPLGLLFLNQFRRPPLTETEIQEFSSLQDKLAVPVYKAMALELARSERALHYQKILKNRLAGIRQINIPFLYAPEFKLSEVQQVADGIEEELSERVLTGSDSLRPDKRSER